MKHILEVKNLTKYFVKNDILKMYRKDFWEEAKPSVDDLSFSVNEGEIFGFIGHNGAGKTTTIKAILSLINFNSGEILINGINSKKDSSRLSVGYLPENPYFYAYLTALELVEYMGGLNGLRGKQLRENSLYYLDKVGLKGKENIKLKNFSKGMVQRTGLAATIVTKPKLLILDEPMSGLDPIGRKTFRDLFLELNKEGTTIFFSSHILSDVEMIADRILIIKNGKKVVLDELINIQNSRVDDYEIITSNNYEVKNNYKSIIKNEKFIRYIVSEKDKNSVIKEILDNSGDIKTVELINNSLEDIFSDILNNDEV